MIHRETKNAKKFTFHNVSINSEDVERYGSGIFHLHSIMYLLIPFMQFFQCMDLLDLHSIMYLLILGVLIALCSSLLFTFHNVSINSSVPERTISSTVAFTFHNVSINSWSECDNYRYKLIYIP